MNKAAVFCFKTMVIPLMKDMLNVIIWGKTLLCSLRLFLFCGKNLSGIESPVYRLNRTLCSTYPAPYASSLINDMFFLRDTRNCIDRAYLPAYLAPDTSIQYKGLCPLRNEVSNRFCRTLRDTKTAYSAFVDIYPR
jgi:hypothetical protein